MKTKLLKRVRKKIRLHKRNRKYFVTVEGRPSTCLLRYQEAIKHYQREIKWEAGYRFKQLSKQRIR